MESERERETVRRDAGRIDEYNDGVQIGPFQPCSVPRTTNDPAAIFIIPLRSGWHSVSNALHALIESFFGQRGTRAGVGRFVSREQHSLTEQAEEIGRFPERRVKRGGWFQESR